MDLTKDTEEEEEEEEVEVEGTAEKVAGEAREGEAPKDYDLLDLGRLGEVPSEPRAAEMVSFTAKMKIH